MIIVGENLNKSFRRQLRHPNDSGKPCGREAGIK